MTVKSIGSRRAELRKELRALDDKHLIARLAKHTGRTPSEEKRRHTGWPWKRTTPVNRSVVEDLIVYAELEGPR